MKLDIDLLESVAGGLETPYGYYTNREKFDKIYSDIYRGGSNEEERE